MKTFRLIWSWIGVGLMTGVISVVAHRLESSPSVDDFSPFKVPSLAFTDVRGDIQHLVSPDRITVVNFWATWCGPCRVEIPDLVDVANRYSNSVRLVGISTDDVYDVHVQEFIRAFGLSYPVIMSTPAIAGIFNLGDALPVTYIVTPDGYASRRIIGRVNKGALESTLEQILRKYK